jgi:hypothetical protein
MINGPCYQLFIDGYDTASGDHVNQVPLFARTIYEDTRRMLVHHNDIIPYMKKVWKDDVQKKMDESGEASVHDHSDGLADIIATIANNSFSMFWKSVAAKDHLLVIDSKILAYVGIEVADTGSVLTKSISDDLQPDSLSEESPEEEIARSMCSLYQ